MYSVYKHTCPNSKVYIGMTQLSPKQRWNNGFGYKYNYRFFRDIVKFGWDNISHEILYTTNLEKEALNKEQEMIARHHSNLAQYGYNCTEGGSTNSLNKPVAQYTLDGEHIKSYSSISNAAAHCNISPSTISKAIKYHTVAHGYFWGLDGDDAVFEINQYAITHGLYNQRPRKRYTVPPERCKPIIQLTKQGEVVNTFNSIAEASKLTNINKGSICSCCKGKKGSSDTNVKTAGGYVWKYAE